MGRKAAVEGEELIGRLSPVFRDVGYEGATLAALAEAAGLQKASLYHRFPGGKEQMAREVLESAGTWLESEVLSPLRQPGPPRERLQKMVDRLDGFYSGGQQACLLNLLSATRIQGGPFTEIIRQAFEAWTSALAAVATDSGFDPKTAQARARRAVMLLQGSLVLARGTGTTEPFRECLRELPAELLAE